MRVISNTDAESGRINVRVISTKEEGLIIGHNNKSMKFGRKYRVKLSSGEKEISGSELERIS
jgi:hypothetical protein